MSARFKPNNVFAILIAVALMATGFVLSFINKQAVSEQETATAGETRTVALPDQASAADDDPETTRPREDSDEG